MEISNLEFRQNRWVREIGFQPERIATPCPNKGPRTLSQTRCFNKRGSEQHAVPARSPLCPQNLWISLWTFCRAGHSASEISHKC